MLNVVCVQTDNYLGRGREYVENLQRAVSEHLTVPYRFVCVTDDYGVNVDTCIPPKFKGWWEKIRLFQPGLFDDRVMFLDLDTLILKNIDHIAAYDGPFATLEDFWRAGRLGPAVMLFDPQYTCSVYMDWEAQGFPMQGNGDQTWLDNLDQGRFRKNADKLQNLFPGEFVSYKEHCTAGRRSWRNINDQLPPPDKARVVCFHGRPRVHECGGWVADTWNQLEVAYG